MRLQNKAACLCRRYVMDRAEQQLQCVDWKAIYLALLPVCLATCIVPANGFQRRSFSISGDGVPLECHLALLLST